jgi:hypothetical protein
MGRDCSRYLFLLILAAVCPERREMVQAEKN